MDSNQWNTSDDSSSPVLKERSEAELLYEREHGRVHRFIRRLIIGIVVLVVAAAVGIAVAYAMLLPRLISTIPGDISLSTSVFPTYSRIVKGTIDFFPGAAAASTADLAKTSSIAFQVSADVIPPNGVTGVARVDFDKVYPLTAPSDIDVRYTYLQKENTSEYDFYFLVSRWPGSLSSVGLTGTDQWFHIASADSGAPTVRELAGALPLQPALTSLIADPDAVSYLLQTGLATGALRWHVAGIPHRNTNGSWVIPINFSFNDNAASSCIAAMKADQQFTNRFASLVASQNARTIIETFVMSIRDFHGTVSVGMFDHMLHDVTVSLDSMDVKTGRTRLSVSSSITRLVPRDPLQSPAKSTPVNGVEALLLLTPLEQATTTPTF